MGLFTVDLPKVLHKKVGGAFQEGEQIRGAFNANPSKSLGKVALGGGLGSEFGSVIGTEMQRRQKGTNRGVNMAMDSAEAKQQQAQDEAGGIAATFPTGALTLAITDRRIAVLSRANAASRLPSPEVVATYELGSISDIEVTKKKMMNDVVVTFADGSALVLEAAKAQGFDRFRDALA